MLKHFTRISKCISLAEEHLSGRRLILIAASICLVAAVLKYHVASAQESMGAYQFAREAQQGKAIVPVPLNLAGKNPELVYIGSYLVNAKLDCGSCHTCPQYTGVNPFTVGGPGLSAPGTPGPVNTAHYLAGGVPFPGRVSSGSVPVATNLTPDSSGKPGGLTYDQFKNVMQNGASSTQPGRVLQVMPWPEFRNLYENDLVAIYDYLSAIPAARPGVCTQPGQNDNNNQQ